MSQSKNPELVAQAKLGQEFVEGVDRFPDVRVPGRAPRDATLLGSSLSRFIEQALPAELLDELYRALHRVEADKARALADLYAVQHAHLEEAAKNEMIKKALAEVSMHDDALRLLPEDLRERVVTLGEPLLLRDIARELTGRGTQPDPSGFGLTDTLNLGTINSVEMERIRKSIVSVLPANVAVAQLSVTKDVTEGVVGVALKLVDLVDGGTYTQVDTVAVMNALQRHVPKTVRVSLRLS